MTETSVAVRVRSATSRPRVANMAEPAEERDERELPFDVTFGRKVSERGNGFPHMAGSGNSESKLKERFKEWSKITLDKKSTQFIVSLMVRYRFRRLHRSDISQDNRVQPSRRRT